MDDRHQLVHRTAEFGAEPNQTVPLARRNIDPDGQLAPKDFVLGLQVSHVSSQLALRGSGQNEKQMPVNVPHGAESPKSLGRNKLISFLHTGSWAASSLKCDDAPSRLAQPPPSLQIGAKCGNSRRAGRHQYRHLDFF
jgi:hypothetical protein